MCEFPEFIVVVALRLCRAGGGILRIASRFVQRAE